MLTAANLELLLDHEVHTAVFLHAGLVALYAKRPILAITRGLEMQWDTQFLKVRLDAHRTPLT
jgi:hypothetical protein